MIHEHVAGVNLVPLTSVGAGAPASAEIARAILARRKSWSCGSGSRTPSVVFQSRMRIVQGRSSQREAVRRAEKRGENHADFEVLEFRDDARHARLTAVVERVVGIPARASCAHLRECCPHVTRSLVDGQAFVSEPSGFVIRLSPGRGRVRSSSLARTACVVRLKVTATSASPAAPTADHFNAVRSRLVLFIRRNASATPVPHRRTGIMRGRIGPAC